MTKDAKKSVKKTSHNAPNEGHEPEPIADLLHEPVADPVPAESQEEQVLEPDVTTTVAYFSADVPKPTMGETNSPTVTKSQPADIPSHTPPNAVAERAPRTMQVRCSRWGTLRLGLSVVRCTFSTTMLRVLQ